MWALIRSAAHAFLVVGLLLSTTPVQAQTDPEVYYEAPRWDFLSDDGPTSSFGQFASAEEACAWGLQQTSIDYGTNYPFNSVDPVTLHRWQRTQTEFQTFVGRACNTYALKSTAVPSCRDGYVSRVTPVGPDIRCVREDLVDPDECDLCTAGISPTSGPPDVQVGNPISVTTGKKVLSENDYASADGLLSISRYYSSSLPSQSRFSATGEGVAFGQFWYGLSPGRLTLGGDNFSELSFLSSSGTNTTFTALTSWNYASPDTSRLKLSFVATPTGTPAQFFNGAAVPNGPGEIKLAMAQGDYILFRRSDTYDPLTQVRHFVPVERGWASGYKQFYTYADTGRYPDKISDSFGRELTLTWTDPAWSTANTPASRASKTLTRVVLPDTTTLDYSYGVGAVAGQPGWTDRLQQVVRKAASGETIWGRSYLYEDSDAPFALTGVLDQVGNRLATYAYNSIGYATSTERAGGVGKTTLQYFVDPANPTRVTRSVTNELGRRTDYVFERDPGDVRATPRRLISITGRATPNLPSDVQTFEYDANGLASGAVNARGAVTAQENEASGKRPTTMTDALGVTRVIEWHPVFDLPTKLLEPTLETEYSYDTGGRPLSETARDVTTQTAPYSTNGEVRTTTYSWLSNGRLQSINGPLPVNALGQDDVTSFTYDAQGNRLTMTNALGHVTSYGAYDANGRFGETTDPNGIKTFVTYDAMGRAKTLTVKHPTDAASDATTNFDYDIEGRVVGITRPDTVKLSFEYDLAGRLLAVVAPDNERIDYTYDAMSNELSTTIRRADGTQSASVARTFDELGRMLTETLGPSRTSRWAYDKNGNPTRVTSPRNNVTQNGFDALDRLVSVVAPDIGRERTVYDDQDNPTRFTDATAVQTRFIRNGFGDVIREISPDRGTSTFYYDAAGHLVREIDGRGQRIDYTRDILGRLTRKRPVGQPATENIDYTWDTPGITGSFSVGRLSRIDDVTGTTKWSYDHRGNMVTQQQRLLGTTAFVSLRYAYDKSDRVERVTYPSGRIVAYIRDTKGRVVAVRTKASAATTSWTTVASGLGYQPFGSVKAMLLGNGLRVANDWGNDGLLASRRLYRANGANLSLLSYGYDTDDNIVSIADGVTPSNGSTYDYDSVGRLSRVSGSDGRTDYAYDANGNRTVVERRASASDPQPQSSDVYAKETGTNRLASITSGSSVRSFAHDARGNLVSETRATTGAINAGYDAWARLTSYSRMGEVALTHVYNGLDDRVATTRDAGTGTAETRRYVYAPDGRVLGEYGASATDVRAEFIWLTPDTANDNEGQPFGGDDGIGGYSPLAVAVNDNAGGTVLNWVHGNHLGVPLVTTDASGNAVTPTGYDLPGFPGQSRTLADLYYNRYRDYDPSTGRYIQADPIGLDGGANAYLYAMANPIRWADPTGLDARVESTPQVAGLHQRISVDTPSGPYAISFGMENGNLPMQSSTQAAGKEPRRAGAGSGIVYEDFDPLVNVVKRFKTSRQEDRAIYKYLRSRVGQRGPYNVLTNSCRDFSIREYWKIVTTIREYRRSQSKLTVRRKRW